MAARALRAAVVIGRHRSGSSSSANSTYSDFDTGAPLLSASWSDSGAAGMDYFHHKTGNGQYRPSSGGSCGGGGRRKSLGGNLKVNSADTSDFSDSSHSSGGNYRRRRSSGSSSLGMQFNDSIISPIMEEMEDGEDDSETATGDGDGGKCLEGPDQNYTSALLQAGSGARPVQNYGSLTDVIAVVGEEDDNIGDSVSAAGGGAGAGDDPQTTRVPWTRRQWHVLAVVLIATCFSSFAVCLFPPFFPRLAEEKGAPAAIYGFIIGTNCLTSFLVTPFLGKSLPKFGVKRSFVTGMIVGGICCAVSGFLQFFAPGWKFVATAVAIRIVHASGNAMVIVATFSYSAVEFQDSVGTMFSFTRTAMNLAQLLGPSVGGAIYQCGGFYLPFISMGALQTGMGLLMICLLPDISSSNCVTRDGSRTVCTVDGTRKEVTITNILMIPTIWFSFMTFIVATMCNGFLSINLEPQVLRHFDLRPFYIGLLFGLKDGANSVSSPIWGYICDKGRKTTVKPYVIINAILVGASFFLLGAGSCMGIDIPRSMPMLIIALSLNGIGIGGEQVAGVVDALHEAIAAGYPDDPAMHGLIAGLWSSLSGAGRFTSRVASGILVDYIGFNATAVIVLVMQALIAGACLIYFLLFECSLKDTASVHWRDVTTIDDVTTTTIDDAGDDDGEDHDEDDIRRRRRHRRRDSAVRRMVFAGSASTAESIMGNSVSINMPGNSRRGRPHRVAAVSVPTRQVTVGNEESPSRAGLVARSLMHQDLY